MHQGNVERRSFHFFIYQMTCCLVLVDETEEMMLDDVLEHLESELTPQELSDRIHDLVTYSRLKAGEIASRALKKID